MAELCKAIMLEAHYTHAPRGFGRRMWFHAGGCYVIGEGLPHLAHTWAPSLT